FEDPLGDFTADTRVVTLAAMAALVGVISAFVALALVRLIGLFTNLAYFQGFDTSFTAPSANALGLWAVGVPVVGGVIVGGRARPAGWRRCSAHRWPRPCSRWSCCSLNGSPAALFRSPARRRWRARCGCRCSAADRSSP